MKLRTGFVSNSSSSSFVLNGSWIKVYGTGITDEDDGSVHIVVAKNHYGFPIMHDDMIKKLRKLFKGIKKVYDGNITTSGSYMYEDDGCFYGYLYGDDVKLAKEAREILDMVIK